MRAAVRLALVLCAALARLPARCQHGETYPESDEADSLSAEPTLCDTYPRIVVTSDDEPFLDLCPTARGNVSVQFGMSTTVYCIGADISKLIMTKDGELLITENYDNNYDDYYAIKWTIKKPDHLQRREYVCTDVETACTRSVTISVILAIDVYSPHGRFSDDEPQIYIIPYGDTLYVLCSGPDATRLTMTRDKGILSTKNKNETTIQWFLQKPDLQISEYVCTDGDTANSRSVLIRVEPAIYIQSRNAKIKPFGFNSSTPEYHFTYDDSIEVICSGPRAVKLISSEEDSEGILTTNGIQTTAKLFIKKLRPGLLTLSCIDSEVSDYKSTVHVWVKLRMDVMSSIRNIYRKYRKFIIKYGNPLEIICSGPVAELLSISKNDIKIKEEVQTVNESAIKFFVKKPDISESWYTCTHNDSFSSSSDVYITVELELLTYIQSQNKTLRVNNLGKMRFYNDLSYGDSIEVFCSGLRPVKLISPEEGNKELLTELINKTTAKMSITISKIGESVIGCIDSEDLHYQGVVQLILYVRTRVKVIASSIIRRDTTSYLIKYGDSLEIYCSAPDAKKLTLFKNGVKMKELQTMNETTRKWIISKPSMSRGDIYRCSTEDKTSDSEVYIQVDVIPEATGFRCVSHDVQYLNCTWSVLSNNSNFTLSYVENGSPTRICAKSSRYTQSRYCVWDSSDSPSYSRDMVALSFQIQSCNLLGCSNQTFLIDHVSIVKPAPPQGLSVHSTTSRDAALHWDTTFVSCAGETFRSHDGAFNYRVEYWHYGIQPLEVNSSLVSCTQMEDCNIELKLPCPGLSYKARVYQKLKKTVGEEFWSDPSTVTFYADEENDSADIDVLTCNEKPRKTKEVMSYFVQQLRAEVRQDLQHMKTKVRSLKAKRDMINRYLNDVPHH